MWVDLVFADGAFCRLAGSGIGLAQPSGSILFLRRERDGRLAYSFR